MNFAQISTVMAVLLLGSAIQGVVGFGMGLVSVPLMMHFLPPVTVPPISIVVGTFMNAIFLWSLRRFVSWKLIAALLFGAALGVMPGVLMLKVIPVGPFRLGAGAMFALSGISLLLGMKCPVKNKVLQFAVGLIAGVLNGALGAPGAPVAFFLAAGDVDKDVFRASIAAFFLALNIITLGVMVQQDVLSGALFCQSLLMLPAIFAGSVLGLRLAKFVPQKLFRRLVTIVIIASGVSLMI